jgi:sugar phosphate isomerase/epimerase
VVSGASAVASGAAEPKAKDKNGERRRWAVACRDAHLPESGEPDIWSAMKAVGVEGVEVTVNEELACPGLFSPDAKYGIASPQQIEMLGNTLDQHKLKISAFCLHNHFDERGEKEIELVRSTVQASAKLGVEAIRLDVIPRRIKDEDEFLSFAIDAGKRVVKDSDDTGVRFGVENHGRTTNKVEFLTRLFDGIGSDRFGITLDTGNFYWFGYPLTKLYDIYDKFAPRACHTHCKSIRYPESEREKQREIGWEYGKYCNPIYDGDIDFERVAVILRGHNYRGDLCIENESLGRFPKEQRREILKKEADLLRRLASA